MSKIGLVILILIIIGVAGFFFWQAQKPEELPPEVIPPEAKPPEEKPPEGLRVGHWVKYSVSEIGIPGPEKLEWLKVEITEIQETEITQLITKHYKDGTTKTETRTVDVSTEADFVTAPNLKIGDSRTGAPPMGTITVSEILTREYDGVSRKVAYFEQITENRSLQLYYDLGTGFLLEEYYELTAFGVKVAYLLESTNLW